MIGKPEGFFIIVLPGKRIVPRKLGLTKLEIDHQGQ